MGSPQVITCTAVTPTLLDVVFEWTGPEGNSIINDSRVTISQTTFDNNDTYTSNLQFAYLMEGDEGNYICTVSLMNAMGVNGSDSTQISNLIGRYNNVIYYIKLKSRLSVCLSVCLSCRYLNIVCIEQHGTCLK